MDRPGRCLQLWTRTVSGRDYVPTKDPVAAHVKDMRDGNKGYGARETGAGKPEGRGGSADTRSAGEVGSAGEVACTKGEPETSADDVGELDGAAVVVVHPHRPPFAPRDEPREEDAWAMLTPHFLSRMRLLAPALTTLPARSASTCDSESLYGSFLFLPSRSVI